MAAARLCLVLAVAQTTGLVHVAIDVATAIAGIENPDECPDDQNGRECPPGCPVCHCCHGAAALPPAMTAAFGDVFFDPATTVTPDSTQASAPRAPVTSGVYRPPRFAPTFV